MRTEEEKGKGFLYDINKSLRQFMRLFIMGNKYSLNTVMFEVYQEDNKN